MSSGNSPDKQHLWTVWIFDGLKAVECRWWTYLMVLNASFARGRLEIRLLWVRCREFAGVDYEGLVTLQAFGTTVPAYVILLRLAGTRVYCGRPMFSRRRLGRQMWVRLGHVHV